MAWIYLTSAALSMLGNGVAGVVWPWLVLERTNNPAAAGMVAAAIAIPSLVFAYFGGNLVDSFGRKPMSIISDIISGLSVAAVILVDNTIGLTITMFIIIGIAGAVGDIPGMAARSALVGDVSKASGKSVEQLSGINQALMGISFLVGPAVAGFMMATMPIQSVLWITSVCSLLAAATTALLRLPASANTEEANAEIERDKGLAGWKIALSFPVIQLLAIDALIATALVAPYLVVLLPARFQQSQEPQMVGIAMSSFALGMVVMGIAAAKIAKFQRLTWVIAMVLYTIAFLCMGFLQHGWMVVAGMFIAGLASGLAHPLQMVLVTNTVPEHIRGRAFSVFTAINQVSGPIGLSAFALILTTTTIFNAAWIAVALWCIAAIGLIWGGIRLIPKLAPEPIAEGSPSAGAATSSASSAE